MAKKKERSSAPKLGAQYQAAKLGLQLAGPPAFEAWTTKSGQAAVNLLKLRDYQKGAAVALLDVWGSKKIGHAAALSRKSLTAIAPEAVAGLDAAVRGNLGPVDTPTAFLENTDGYSTTSKNFNVDRVKPYVVAKYGLAIGRKAAKALVPGVYDMVNSALGKMGVHV